MRLRLTRTTPYVKNNNIVFFLKICVQLPIIPLLKGGLTFTC